MRSSVPVPADIDMPDRILAGLTARQIAVLAPVAVALIAVWRGLQGHVPFVALLAITAPVAALAVVVVTGRRDGASLDTLAWAAIRHPRRPLAPGAVDTHAAVWSASDRSPKPRGLRGPVKALSDTEAGVGVLDLGVRGAAIALDAGTVNITLRSSAEQWALIGGFARLLHSLGGHLQIVTSTAPVDITDHIADVRATATAHTSVAVARAGRAYATWLSDVISRQRLTRRRLTIVVRAATPEAAERCANTVADACAAIGVATKVLSAGEWAARVRETVDPFHHDEFGGVLS